MEQHPLAFKWLLFIFLVCSTYLITANATHSFMIPRLSPVSRWETSLHDRRALQATNSEDVKTFYYKQTLDHFNYRPQSYQTFQQRYLINFRYWGGSGAPIFAYLGAEAPIDSAPTDVGFLADNAASFNALLVYIEHRYYGQSVPFGSAEDALKNASTIGYFNSAQAMADYAEVIIHIKKTLHAKKSPVIVIGGSYGGMLAAWFRLKYPHLAIGAFASSAPVLYSDSKTPRNSYYSVLTRVFREASETCYETIRKSWSEIRRVASQPNGLSILSQRFNTCHPLNKTDDLVNYLEQMYTDAAQYNSPPRYPVTVICGGIDGASFGSDILSKIYAGLVANHGNDTCNVNGLLHGTQALLATIGHGWSWQVCSELIMYPIKGNDSMFEPSPRTFEDCLRDCEKEFGVTPRPHWVTTYYGGHDIKLALKRFGSNIIFSNGLKDPWSNAGILDNISDSIVAVNTVNGSHCLDFRGANESDPEWLVEQRKKEIEIMKRWLTQYYADLGALKWVSKFQSEP